MSLAPPRASRRGVAFGLMLASGFAGLGYQIVWTQQGALWLGHESASVLAVVTAFFGGLALGAAVLGSRIERSARPERWYAACEAVIALWSVLLALLLAPVGHLMLALIGVQPAPMWQWAVAFGGSFLLLLPATVAMGATLPAMERVLSPRQQANSQLAALYACNTFGALLGVLAAAFWLVPAFGLARTAGLCALLNLACATAALRMGSNAPDGQAAVSPPSKPVLTTPRARGARALLAATGLLGIGYEVLVVRVLSQVAEDTVYTFALLLAVYLVGSALGAAAYARKFAGSAPAAQLRDRLLVLQASACLLGCSSLWAAERVHAWVQMSLGAGMGAALAAEAVLALAAFGLPTVVMGALFSHLATQARQTGLGVGRAWAWNTLGAAVAPLLFGVLLLPALGPKAALLLVAAGYLAAALPRAALRPCSGVPAAVLFGLALWAPPLAFIDVPVGGRVVSYREGALAAVSVVEDAAGVARLRIDNRQQEGSSATQLTDGRQALLPLLLHAAPRRALFLGLGTGVTASTAARDPGLQVDAVELLPEVIAASAYFTGGTADATGAAGTRLHVMAADARRYVRSSTQRYDVIVADNFHPARSGSGSLYTVEHFEAVRARLAGQGVFCQWLPLHQLDLDTLRSIVRSFLQAFPQGQAMLATNSLETPVLGLIGHAGEPHQTLQAARQRLASATLPRLADFGLADDLALLGGFIAGPQALARFSAAAPLNTDDHPVVAYRAPRITYAPDSLPAERLLTLLRELSIDASELLGRDADAAAAQRLDAYWQARDRFLEAGRGIRPHADLRRMLAQVREPLLSVLRISPDFRPAYDPLLRMATALVRDDPAGARALLVALQTVQPARVEAGQALARLTATPP